MNERALAVSLIRLCRIRVGGQGLLACIYLVPARLL